MDSPIRSWTLPTAPSGLRIANGNGLSAGILPNAGLLAIEHDDGRGAVTISQVRGAPLDGGIFRLWLRIGGATPSLVQAIGPAAAGGLAVGATRAEWTGEAYGLSYAVTMELHPVLPAWRWRIEALNGTGRTLPLDAVLAQDLGLGPRGFLMNNEAYASQYIDHRPTPHAVLGTVLMSRQNLAQDGRHPWLAQWCAEGAAGFATDALQLFGPAHRDAAEIAFPFGTDLPSRLLQHEAAMGALQSRSVMLAPGETASWSFVALFQPDHPAASSDADLAAIAALDWPACAPGPLRPVPVVRSLLQDATPLRTLKFEAVEERFPDRIHEERRDGDLLSFFVAEPPLNRHVVLAAKERLVARRHGALLRSGTALLPDEATLCSTAWMHGIFAAQLTIGNTSFHKLFSVSRDAYGIIRSSGLRILAETESGWRLLTVPSAFEIGLSDCRWIYRTGSRTIAVQAIAAGSDAAMQWRVTVEGPACRLLVFGQLVLGEREGDHAGRVDLDSRARCFALRPDPNFLWGQRYPDAVYHLTVTTAIEAIGGDELLYPDGVSRDLAYIAFRTPPTRELVFTVTGSMTDPAAALALAHRHAGGAESAALLAPAREFWAGLAGSRQFGAPEFDTILPWMVHDAIIHLTVPHGLEQYTGAAWGTRDVCQGPVEALLALGQLEPVRAILRIVFAQQYQGRGDWPQWFMLEPYSVIQDRTSHGDVIVWPLKALCDYVEATGDLGLLDEEIPWRDLETLERTTARTTVRGHVETLLATIAARFVPGTALIRLGEGDWNDSLQLVDPTLRERMVSSWTVALLIQQIRRWAAIQRRRGGDTAALDRLAHDMVTDFQQFLVRDGTVAGYALFAPSGGEPELLLHPTDTRTGLRYSLLPMTQAMLGGLFDADATAHHEALIRAHLLDPDGARLIDRPPDYRGGVETVFRRAESAAFVGREIGLMYVHSHLRWAETRALAGDRAGARDALLAVNPIAVTDLLPQAGLRQRNAYFSSSDAAFPDRRMAGAEWARVRDGSIAVEGGWRIYSSGPGLYINLLIRHFAGPSGS